MQASRLWVLLGRRGPALTLVFSALSLIPAAGHGQAALADRGVALPPQPIAMPRGALSLVSNPAGLAEVEGTELRLQAALGGRDLTAARHTDLGGSGWGAFVGTGIAALRLGASLEHRSDGIDDGVSGAGISRLGLGAAFGIGDRVQVGASTRLLAAASPDGSSPWSSSFGVLIRPWSWVSLGWTVQGLGSADDAAASDGPAFTTRYAMGVAARPLAGSRRLTATFDVEWQAGGHMTRQQLSLHGEPWRGLGVGLQVRGLPARGRPGAVDELQTTLQLDLGFSHYGVEAGLRSGQAVVTEGDASPAPTLMFGARWSSDVPPSLTQPGAEAVLVPLAGSLDEHGGGKGFARLLLDLDALADDPVVRTVVFRFDDPALSWSQVEELREVIGRIRAAGKRTASYAASYGTRALMVAVATERIGLAPAGTMAARGVGTDFIGLGKALGALGVRVEAVRFGDHKSAPELLTSDAPSEPLRATLRRHVERRWQDFREAVALGRGLTPSDVDVALAQGVVEPESARAARLIDDVQSAHGFERLLRKDGWLATGSSLRPYEPVHWRRSRWGKRERIVVFGLQGDIVDGESGRGLRGGEIGGTSVARELDALREDSAVRGVVMRVDSGGGAVYGSDLIREGLLRLSERTPTVVSMASVAASGGYWLALGSDKIFADRATVTGSIGIWVAKPDISGLLSRLGVGVHPFGLGPGYDATSALRPWSPADLERVRGSLHRYYQMFLRLVAERRKIALDAMPAVAEGRIWLGDEALLMRLVDRRAGLLEAIADVRARADLADPDDTEVVLMPKPGLQLMIGARVMAAVRALGLRSAGQEGDPAALADEEPAWLRAEGKGRRLLSAIGGLAGAAGPWLDRATWLAALPAEAPLALSPLPPEPPGR